jgi:hypothetical protein
VSWQQPFFCGICYRASVDWEIAVPSSEEIEAARSVLTDDRIVDMQRGITSPENVIKLMLEAAEKVRSSGAGAQPTTAEWDQPHLWPAPLTDK